jgi:hypothetical protein
MPLISSFDSDNGRTMFQVVARSAANSLAKEAHADRLKNFDDLQSAFRMLKSYRLGIFSAPPSHGIGQAVEVVDLEDEEDAEAGSPGVLTDAFRKAQATAFGTQMEVQEAALELQKNLQAFLNASQPDELDEAMLTRTRNFFSELDKELSK